MTIVHYFNNGASSTLCGVKFPLGTSLNDGNYHMCTMGMSEVNCDDCVLLHFADKAENTHSPQFI